MGVHHARCRPEPHGPTFVGWRRLSTEKERPMGTGRQEPSAGGSHDQRPRPAGRPGLLDAARLLTCSTPRDLLDTALELALRITVRGPLPTHRRAFLYRLRPDGWLQLTDRLDLSSEQLSPYQLVPPDAGLPVAQAVREGEPVVSATEDATNPYPGHDQATNPAKYLTHPLSLDGRVLGGVVLCLPVGATLDDEELAQLAAVVELFSQRLYVLTGRPAEAAREEGLNQARTAHGASAVAALGDTNDAGDKRDTSGEQTAGGERGTSEERNAPGAGEAPAGNAKGHQAGGHYPAPRATSPHDPAATDTPSRREHLVRSDHQQLRSNLDPMVDMALSNAGVGSFDWDFPSGRLIWDERTCHVFGVDPEEFDGRIETFYDRAHPDDRTKVHAAVQESHRTGFFKSQFRIVLPDGSIRHVEAESRVIFSPEGVPFGMAGIARDRTRDVRRAEHNRRRQEFVMRVTRGFTAASSTSEIVTLMADTVMPTIAASKLAILLRESEHPPRWVGLRGFRKEEVTPLVDAIHRLRTAREPNPVQRGRTLLLADREQFHATFPFEDLHPLPDEQAWLVLPLSTADGLSGICVLSFEEAQDFTTEDEAITTAVAGILAQSLARTRLFDERRSQLTELQQLMLPRRLPQLPGLEVAVGYRPGSRGLMVGGDWYDALAMPDGRVSVIIGDVQGHNVQAAAVMGQLRTVMRAFASEGNGLSALLARGNRALNQMDTDLFATCAIVEIDTKAGTVRMARAGHPYPLLAEPSGRVYEVEAAGGMPLGCFPEDEYPVSDLPLPKGGTLLLYTDGLVENTGMEYDDAVDAIIGQLARWARHNAPERSGGRTDLELLAEEIITPTTAHGPYLDDVAVLLVRRPT